MILYVILAVFQLGNVYAFVCAVSDIRAYGLDAGNIVLIVFSVMLQVFIMFMIHYISVQLFNSRKELTDDTDGTESDEDGR